MTKENEVLKGTVKKHASAEQVQQYAQEREEAKVQREIEKKNKVKEARGQPLGNTADTWAKSSEKDDIAAYKFMAGELAHFNQKKGWIEGIAECSKTLKDFPRQVNGKEGDPLDKKYAKCFTSLASLTSKAKRTTEKVRQRAARNFKMVNNKPQLLEIKNKDALQILGEFKSHYLAREIVSDMYTMIPGSVGVFTDLKGVSMLYSALREEGLAEEALRAWHDGGDFREVQKLSKSVMQPAGKIAVNRKTKLFNAIPRYTAS